MIWSWTQRQVMDLAYFWYNYDTNNRCDLSGSFASTKAKTKTFLYEFFIFRPDMICLLNGGDCLGAPRNAQLKIYNFLISSIKEKVPCT